ncbi:MAG TPA: GTP-binding protein [Burkholderiales bacterium]|jgi:sulfate adenylyltransferase subunit 1|nr:GTP-binding protein [Burkholderiales bacterium]
MGAHDQIEDLGVLRFITAGSVDDGKSTLIGRLLHDTRAVLEDQLAAVSRASNKKGVEYLDLSLLTDGLEAEREQGITIDVAYRYFATAKRKFIIADTPGHEQYTRNMVTGASTADAAFILIDARKGVLPQSRRHTYIAHLLGVKHIIVAVNKMDLVNNDRAVFDNIQKDFTAFADKLGIKDLRFFPVSALLGDMVVNRGESFPWYNGHTLLEALESIEVRDEAVHAPMRFPVQLVVRPGQADAKEFSARLSRSVEAKAGEVFDFRGYAGRVDAGVIRVGDEVVVLPANRTTRVRDIVTLHGSQDLAIAGDSVTVLLEDEIDISRGDMIAPADKAPQSLKTVNATVCWLSTEGLNPAARYVLKHTARIVKAKVAAINHKLDIHSMEKLPAPSALVMNDIANITINLAQPIFVDNYAQNRPTGAFILIDEATNQTVAAGMIEA